MKRILGLLLLFLATWGASAQVLDHTQESYRPSQEKVKVGEEIELIFEVTIAQDWYIYSTEFEADGPLPTEFVFEPHSSYQLVGKPQAINPKKKFDDVWEAEVAYFEKKAEFRQKIKILQKNPQIKGSFAFQTCSNVTGQCLPPEDVEFHFKNIQVAANAKPETKPEEETNKAALEEQEEDTSSDENTDSPKEEKEEAEAELVDDSDADQKDDPENELQTKEKTPAEASVDPVLTSSENTAEDRESMLGFAFLAFLAGLVALLTPCVFPMIPMTVTFFTRNKNQNLEGLSSEDLQAIARRQRQQILKEAAFYGFSIIAIYTLIGTGISWINGPAFANWLSTHWLPNLFFFVVFVIFALSFLGMFEIVLPSSWVNRADSQADKGGYYGIFFMAFTLTLVSFSCTGPIVGSILVQSAGGAIVKPIVGMFAFSLALALPFSLFAAFPSWLNSLPQSGGWLNSVKVVLGFLELALALKFLSIADQVYHWGILDRDVFLAFWIVIFALIGFYLLGKIRMPHDSPLERISVPRVILATLSFSFVIYLVPGMIGAPLKPLAGYLPPQHTIDFDLYALTTRNNNTSVQANQAELPPVKYADFLTLPHDLRGFFDYEQGVAYAQKVNKPVFIDFTGHGCVNCREMEARVWSNPAVLSLLREKYVVIALYVDDKKQLPEQDWYTSSYDDKIKKTIGAQNADFQIRQFNNNAQPFYCLLDHDGKLLVEPKAYDLNPNHFVEFLEKGLKEFKKRALLANN